MKKLYILMVLWILANSFVFAWFAIGFALHGKDKVKTVTIRENVLSECEDNYCQASEACKNQGGRLTNYYGNNWKTEYKFECEYDHPKANE